VPDHISSHPPAGTCQLLDQLGPEKFAEWTRSQKRLLITDTTFRDAHQSLMATRVRTHDMTAIANFVAHKLHNLYSLEMWGGATFDVAMRFLLEDPWLRLTSLREAIPNICFQMFVEGVERRRLFGLSDNVVEAFILEAAAQGIDIFRVFDSLNWMPNMKAPHRIRAEIEQGLRSGHLLHGRHTRPAARKILAELLHPSGEGAGKMGAHVLCIKDMGGLCKPVCGGTIVHGVAGGSGAPDSLPHA